MSNNYMTMFNNPIVQEHLLAEEVTGQIRWAKQYLKKTDKIVWFLRVYRMLALRAVRLRTVNGKAHDAEASATCLALAEQLMSRHKSVADVITNVTEHSLIEETLKDLKVTLKHYQDLNVATINAVEFKDKTFNALCAEMERLETQWKLNIENKARELSQYGNAVLTSGQFTWFELGVSGCEKEAKSMGHCGNGLASPTSLDRVYSLREKGSKAGKWIPHITLILKRVDSTKEAGFTTEIKGRFNQKPTAQFHEALMAFVCSERVLGLKDGGHLPENNFKLLDLTQEQRKRVKEKKPELFDFCEHLYDANGVTNSVLEKSLLKYGSQEQAGCIDLGEISLSEFADENEMHRLMAYRNLLLGNYDELCDDDREKLIEYVQTHISGMYKSSNFTPVISFNEESVFLSFSLSYNDFIAESLTLTSSSLETMLNNHNPFNMLVEHMLRAVQRGSSQEDIADKYDSLLHETDRFVLNNGEIDSVITKQFLKHPSVSVQSEFGPCKPFVEVFDGCLESFARDFDCENLKHYTNTLDEGYFEFSDFEAFDYGYLDSAAIKALETLDLQQLKQLINVLNEYVDIDDKVNEDVDLNTTSKLMALAKDESMEHCFDFLYDAQRNAHETGAYDELYEAYSNAIDNIADEINANIVCNGTESIKVNMDLDVYLEYVKTHVTDKHYLYEVNCDMETLEESFADAMHELSEHCCSDLDVPYYGFSGFCDSVAKDYIVDGINNLLIEQQKALAA